MYSLLRTVDVLKEWKEINLLNSFISILNKKGVILDEENHFKGISSVLIEKWDKECTEYILINGYEREAELHCLAFEVNYRGFVYALFDSEMFDISSVKKYIEDYNYL